MKTAEELERMFGMAPERITEIDGDAEKGVLHGKAVETVTGAGRPPMFDEPMRQVTFKAAGGKVEAMDRRARQLGMRRSDYLRQLVENDLRCTGMA